MNSLIDTEKSAPTAEPQGHPGRVRRVAARAGRLLGVPLGFVTFGLGGIIFGLVLVPLALLIREPQQRQRALQKQLAVLVRLWLGSLRVFDLADWRVVGAPPAAPAPGLPGLLVVANHPSLIDALFLITLFKEPCFVIKQGVVANPVMRLAVRALGYISNADPAAMLEDAVTRLRGGTTLIVFPEATRSIDRARPEFRLGAATIAVRAGVNCLPVTLFCDTAVLGKQHPWHRVPTHCVRWQLGVGAPIDTAAVTAGLKPRYGKRELTRHLQEYFTVRLSALFAADAPSGQDTP